MKHYTFSSIWEDAVRRYLGRHFVSVKGDIIELSDMPLGTTKFLKKTFSPNEAANAEYFQPDCYLEKGDAQYIFDAKYYVNSHGLMYKELAYILLLKDMRDYIDKKPIFSKTYCAVILPSEERKTLVNFKMNPLYNQYYGDVKIMEEYFDIKKVLLDYLID